MGTGLKYIWMDGQLVEAEKATVNFMNPALHYGLGVFEGLRCYRTDNGPAVFRLRDHMQRLLNSAKILGFRNLPYNVDELCQAVKDTISANGLQGCYIRPLIFNESDVLGLNLDKGWARVGIAAWQWDAYLGPEAQEKGIRAHVASFTRHHINVMMTKAKTTGNYSNSVLAKTEAVRLGFDEAIMLDPQGYVAECSGENVFLVRNNVIYTPGAATILEGITRDSVIQLARDLGYTVNEGMISRDQLYIADEVFFTGSAAEVVAVTEIDFRTIGGSCMGPVTRDIQKAFQALVTGHGSHSAEWLDYVKSEELQSA